MSWKAKDIRVAPVAVAAARSFVKRHHYSGRVVNNSQLHLGVWLPDGLLHGVMQFGPPFDKSKVLGLVRGTAWHSMLELNRMAFDEVLPKNSESRALGVALRLIRKNYPHIEWVVSFSDGTQSGDGTIYRASGFVLTQIKKNSTILRLPSGEVVSKMSVSMGKHILATGRAGKPIGAEALPGFQLRYLYPLRDDVLARLTCPVLPFSAIDEAGARMYRGRRGGNGSPGGTTTGEGGSTPTSPLEVLDDSEAR